MKVLSGCNNSCQSILSKWNVSKPGPFQAKDPWHFLTQATKRKNRPLRWLGRKMGTGTPPEPQLPSPTPCPVWSHREAKVGCRDARPPAQPYQGSPMAWSDWFGLLQLKLCLENTDCFLNVINCHHLLQSSRVRPHTALGRTWGCSEAQSPSASSWGPSETPSGRKSHGGNVLLELLVWDLPLVSSSFPPPPDKLQIKNT